MKRGNYEYVYSLCQDYRCKHYRSEHGWGKMKLIYSKDAMLPIGDRPNFGPGCANAGCNCKKFKEKAYKTGQKNSKKP